MVSRTGPASRASRGGPAHRLQLAQRIDHNRLIAIWQSVYSNLEVHMHDQSIICTVLRVILDVLTHPLHQVIDAGFGCIGSGRRWHAGNGTVADMEKQTKPPTPAAKIKSWRREAMTP